MRTATRFSTLATPALALLVLAITTGCSAHPPALARVGTRDITVQEFTEVAQRAGGMYGVQPDSAKRRLLDDLVQRALLIEAARGAPWAAETELRALRDRTEREILSGALVQRLLPRTLPVSEGEIQRLYERRAQEAHLQVIYTFDENLARAAKAELDRGTSFTDVANRFNLPGMLPAGGDLGFVAPGTIPSPLDDYLTEAPIGKILGPVHAADEAWYVARVLARRPRTQEPFEQQRDAIAQTLQQRKRRALSINVFRKLREEYELVVEPGAPQLLFARYNHAPEDTNDTQDPTLVLARYRDENGHELTYKLRDAMDDLESGTGDRPNPSMLPSFEQWIEGRVVQRIVLIEARRRQLQNEPEIARAIQDRIDGFLLNTIYQSEIAENAHATPQDLQMAFARQAPMLTHITAAKVQYITLPDSASALKVIERVQGRTLKDAILLASPGMSVREQVITFPSRDPEWAGLERGLQKMPNGSFGGPIHLPSGWRVIQLISTERSTMTPETLTPEAMQMLQVEADNLARDRRLTQYSDSLRHVLPVNVDLDRLKRVPWPEATAPFTG